MRSTTTALTRTHTHTHTHTHTRTHKHAQTHARTHTQAGRERDRYVHTDRLTDRQTDRQTIVAAVDGDGRAPRDTYTHVGVWAPAASERIWKREHGRSQPACSVSQLMSFVHPATRLCTTSWLSMRVERLSGQ
eukprot:GHVU01091128.1.p1 GENE.GHVU01091128.1~~GHVU01091128.1.p1  ORF type:complete len:133 (-),score=9.05 GHVU01091128.1:237-635(-)